MYYRYRASVRSALALLSVASLMLGASGHSALASPVADDPQAIVVTLTNDGCTASPASARVGPATFTVRNVGGDKVTEVELVKNDLIIGEKENLAPGLSGTFSVNLSAGDYELYCPDADTERTAFAVEAMDGSTTASIDPAVGAALDKAATDYRTYVQGEVTQLVTETQALAVSVDAGDIDQAKAAYSRARVHYERIEPVAESFGDLDPAIDMREDDATNGAEFTGFHRLEQALWQDDTLANMGPVAHDLLANVQELQTLVNDPTAFSFDAAQVANGAVELLDEVGKSKITGEEERYSHLDLLDMAANVDGSRKGFELLKPGLVMLDPTLADTITTRFQAMDTAMAPYKRGDGWLAYDQLSAVQVRALSQAVGDLAEPLSQVAARIVTTSGGALGR
jgi:iron uptake system component EfeO